MLMDACMCPGGLRLKWSTARIMDHGLVLKIKKLAKFYK